MRVTKKDLEARLDCVREALGLPKDGLGRLQLDVNITGYSVQQVVCGEGACTQSAYRMSPGELYRAIQLFEFLVKAGQFKPGDYK